MVGFIRLRVWMVGVGYQISRGFGKGVVPVNLGGGGCTGLD